MNINEENKDLDKKGEFVIVPDEFKGHFKSDKVSYTNLTTKKNRLEKNPNISPEEQKLLNWVNKKFIYLGSFNTEEEAYQARCDYEKNNNIENKYL